MENQNDSLLSVKDESNITKLNQSVLYTVIHFDKLKHETIAGKLVIRQDDLNEWMKTNLKKDKKEVIKKVK